MADHSVAAFRPFLHGGAVARTPVFSLRIYTCCCLACMADHSLAAFLTVLAHRSSNRYTCCCLTCMADHSVAAFRPFLEAQSLAYLSSNSVYIYTPVVAWRAWPITVWPPSGHSRRRSRSHTCLLTQYILYTCCCLSYSFRTPAF